MALLISDTTLIDGRGSAPATRQDILVVRDRIVSIGATGTVRTPENAQRIDGRGKFLIPGLLNANVHLLGDVRVENLVRHFDQFDQLILEAAQIALRNGITTVFDTWGPRRALMAVRDRINDGKAVGSRIYCAGNIVGFDGPYSHDFIANAGEVASPDFVERINAIWVENVGRHLMWLTPEQVGDEVGHYIDTGIDFVKYASNEHFGTSAGAFLAFSPAVQSAIVERARGRNLSVQAHTTSVEGLRLAVEAGCDIIQHANITGPTVIPESTLRLMRERGTRATLFPYTANARAWMREHAGDAQRTMLAASDENVSRLMGAGVEILLANDGALLAPEARSDPKFARMSAGLPKDENLYSLDTGHFAWFAAMEQKGLSPLEMLKAATLNIAQGYGVADRIGSIEEGKIADMLVLSRDPLAGADNFRSIEIIVMGGAVVDRETLPVTPILTSAARAAELEQGTYKPFHFAKDRFASFPLCMCH